jgi:flagellar biosynthesis protein FlhB
MVARSATLSSAIVLIASAVAIYATSPATALGDQLRGRLSTLHEASDATLVSSITESTWAAARALLPVALVLLAAAILANIGQVGLLFTLSFGPHRAERSLWRPVLALIAAAAVAVIVGLSLRPVESWTAFTSLLFTVSIRTGLALLALGLLDYAVQRRRLARMLRMTREEVRREQRENARAVQR